MVDGSWARTSCYLARNLVTFVLLYAIIYTTVQTTHDALETARAEKGAVIPLSSPGGSGPTLQLSDEVQVKSGSLITTEDMHSQASGFNRPFGAVVPKDDFLGPRPHVDTQADLQMIVAKCRGTYVGLERMRNVFDCLQFLADRQEQYYSLPELKDRASEQNPREAEYLNADGHGNTLDRYVAAIDSEPASESKLGTCSGPIIPYHVYWSGPATFRVEMFVKSYLYTQNLPCSRLWLWLDADRSSVAVQDMLTKDPVFARFLPFVQRGDIRVLSWNFPSKIPLPHESGTANSGYYKSLGDSQHRGEVAVSDGIVEDSNGQQWAFLTAMQMTTMPQVISDAVRFVILHLHGGVYVDADIIMLRDFRPLLLAKVPFAERWGAHPHPGDYNTAIMSLTANSSLSAYLLHGGIRMGLNFHPRVIGRMAWKDGRNQELVMLETAAFDPIWSEFNGDREGRCTVPCLRDYGAVFKGKPEAIRNEWESYHGSQLRSIDEASSASFCPVSHSQAYQVGESITETHCRSMRSQDQDSGNRTLENFFRGAWTYHIHNQWSRHAEPGSWLDVVQKAHDGFFAGERMNPYGEYWSGPRLAKYNKQADD